MVTSSSGQLLQGRGRFVADRAPPGTLYGAFVRSPHAHATITSIDIAGATCMPGVVMVLTADGLSQVGALKPAFGLKETGSFLAGIRRQVLCGDRVRHPGDPVALVVGTCERIAQDAAEAVMVDYDPLSVAIAGCADTRPELFLEAPGNVAMRWSAGNVDATAAAFASAARVVTVALRQSRVAPAPMEPRGVLAYIEPESGRLVLEIPCQGASLLRDDIAASLGKPSDSVRLLTGDVGGSFGMKVGNYPEYVAVAAAAIRLGRPVRWISSRSEAFCTDTQARDVASVGELALDGDGRFLALRVRHEVDLGAYVSFAAPHASAHGLAMARTGLYTIAASSIEVSGRVSNAPWTDAYRGAGKPESILMLERLVDEAAAVCGIDRLTLRRRNLIRPAQLPYVTPAGERYESGDFLGCLERATEAAGWAQADARAREAKQRGRFYGIGLASWLDVTSAGPTDRAWLRLNRYGVWSAGVGTQDTGQGHLAGFTAIVARHLDVAVSLAPLQQGDSDGAPLGGGTYGAKTMGVAGAAMAQATNDLVDQARFRAAQRLGVGMESVRYMRGIVSVPDTNHALTLAELAEEEDLVGSGEGGGSPTYPNGCHVCEVEIDGDTGLVDVVSYTAVDDYGPILHRAALEGQLRGGIVQGIGQALFERIAFDQDSGQITTGSFMDYCMPRAQHFPPISLYLSEDHPCPTNPIGVKGSGQAGTIGALAATMNAVNDALRRAGADPVDPPATPLMVWRRLHSGS